MGKSFAESLRALFGKHTKEDESFFEDLTDVLIEGDIGAALAVQLVDALENACRTKRISGTEAIKKELSALLLPYANGTELLVQEGKVNIFLVLGVNGVGKTTSVAKMAKYFADKRVNVIMSASDTFRAAAIDQLVAHGERLNIRVVHHQMGSDPSAVVFDAAEAMRASGGGLVLTDTAGRLHNKENLVNELKKIDRVASAKADEGCYKKILVVDATTGQNALRQAEVFHEAVGLDALVLTKYDSTAKGGAVITIGKELSVPTAFVCTGEKYGDISLLDSARYIAEFLG